MNKLALVIPHKKSAQGATDYNGETEYVKMTRVLKKVKENLKYAQVPLNGGFSIHLEVKLFERTSTISEVCDRVVAFEPDLSLENHFNAGGGQGVEILCLSYASDIKTSQKLASNIGKTFDIPVRREKGAYILKGYERGAGNIEQIKEELPQCTPLLVETFFGDSKEESKKFAKGVGENLYIKLLTLFILDHFNAKIIPPAQLPTSIQEIQEDRGLPYSELTIEERLTELEDKVEHLKKLLVI